VVTQNENGEEVSPFMSCLRKGQLKKNDLITAVLVPKAPLPAWEIEQAKRRQMPGEMVAGVVAAGASSDGVVDDLRLASYVATRGVQRWTAVEQLVTGKTVDDELLQAVRDSMALQIQTRWGDAPEAGYHEQVVVGLICRCLRKIGGRS